MSYNVTIRNRHFTFHSIKEILSKANEEKSGDKLAGIAAATDLERIAAKKVLSTITLAELRANPVVPYEEDEVTQVIDDDLNVEAYNRVKDWTVAQLREFLLDDETDTAMIRAISPGLTSEMAAAVTKVMSNLDLISAAKKARVISRANTTLGLTSRLAARLQPNDPTDNIDSIIASIYEGLSYGAGDAVIGINPVNDSLYNTIELLKTTDEIINKFEIPTQNCVLAHVTTQVEALENGAPAGLVFQSLAGSQKGNEGFGVTVKMLDEAYQLALEKSQWRRDIYLYESEVAEEHPAATTVGNTRDESITPNSTEVGNADIPNVIYFETGQGSELSSNAHHDADQLTLEARCYGLARRYKPFMVNTVVGFIGPEYLYDSKQVIRAGLEDHFMGKLMGVPMGVDVCYANHINADQNDVENLAVLLAAAGANYFMAVPMGDDIMLNYQSTSHHDIASLRQLLNLRPAPEFEKWLEKMGLMEQGKLTTKAGDPSVFTRMQ